jgi:hypothetical protein
MISCRAVEIFSFSLSLLDVADKEEFVDNLGEFELGSGIKTVEKVADVEEGE